ncbi:uncharacterized protein DEA37_0005093 [Paragonimus westermani]|uniref:Uncharacterized protein n=1 Tax=Paragonimus westermani TaxID=34504 RepID=A0A5J4N752_9TREM|nr:uncharacterized protein DEA37_0005093 [Paragonimus westermani]
MSSIFNRAVSRFAHFNRGEFRWMLTIDTVPLTTIGIDPVRQNIAQIISYWTNRLYRNYFLAHVMSDVSGASALSTKVVSVVSKRKTVTNLPVVCAWAPNDRSDVGIKDVPCSDLAALLRATRGSDIVVLARASVVLIPKILIAARPRSHRPFVKQTQITRASREADTLECGTVVPGVNKYWILEKSLDLLEARRNILHGSLYNSP